MRQLFIAAGVALGSMSGLAPAHAVERLTTQVQLNHEEKGNFAITLTDAGKILFRREDLLRLGIKELPSEAAGEDGYVSLSPQVRAEFDREGLQLQLTVEPALLGMTANAAVPAAAPATRPTAQRAVANVHLNREEKGDYFFSLTEQGGILIAHDDLLAMGITALPAGVASTDGIVELGAQTPSLSAQFDEKASILYLTVAPELLDKTTIDLARQRPADGMLLNDDSGFINYGLSYTADDDLEFASLSVPLEAGITRHGYLGVSSFSYLKDTDDDRFVRLMSSIVKDDPPNRTRLIAGDFSTSSGMLGSGGLYGGLSFATKFALDPYALRYPGANLYGAVNAPSDVDVYVNGLLVSKQQLSPGEFEFINVGNVQGSGEATLVIKDGYGGEEIITVPYYTSAQLLRAGLHDYSYSVGYQRQAFGQESNEYGDAAFLGYHRVGISDALTAGLRAEGDSDVVNGGASATFLVGTLGEFDTALAVSREDDVTGNAWSARYTRASREVNWGLFARGFSRDYANLALTRADDKSRRELSANLGFRQDMLGSISFFFSKRDMYVDIDRKRYGINYNRRLGKQVSLNIVAARTVTDSTTNEVFANLIILLGNSRSANVAVQKQGSESAARVSLQQNAPLGTGYGYRLSADRRISAQDDPANGGDAYLQYRGDYGIYSAEHRIIDGTSSSAVGTAGGIAFINRSAYFTRPIYDGFVLAKVGEFEKVAVNYNHQPVGVTDKNGELLIPGLLSYYKNSISIDDKALPINYELAEVNKSVSVPFRAGGVVEFSVKKLQGFTGRLVISERGKKTVAEYWGLKVTQGPEAKEVTVGKRGEFYLENLPAGRLQAQLFSKEKSCSFELVIPDSDDVMVDMGEVICERN